MTQVPVELAPASLDRSAGEIDGVECPDHPKPWAEIAPRAGLGSLDLREIWAYRDLLIVLAGRDVKLRYRQTALGALWVVLQPLLAAGVFSFVFGRVLNAPSDGVPYFAFSFAGLLAYNAFSGTLGKASACIVTNAPLVSKVYFPRLILPLSTVPGTLIDFAVGAVLMAIMLAAGHLTPGWGVLLIPVWLAVLVTLAVGLGTYTAGLMVRYRDLQYVIPVLVQLILYASPIAYPVSRVPASLRFWLYLNPLTGVLEAFRWSLFGRGSVSWPAVAYSGCCAVAAMVLGALAFRHMERDFADVI